ncbi:MAG: DNA-processing protein DprA [Chloroflexota bacterium]
MNEKHYWLGFNLVKGIGAVRLRALKEYFGDLAVAWEATSSQLLETGLSPRIVENIIKIRTSVNLENYYENIQSKGINVVISDEDNYPDRLKEIDQPPPVLYIRGKIEEDDFWSVAIVGTRRVTAYGRQVADELATYLAQNGVTVISGMARGVDAIAHQAALRAGGRTLAVLGCGVDRIYPPEHRNLADQIMDQGAILSDYAPGTPPDSSNFPPRNRIISGLSIAVVVVEAAETSGALITANFAADQGRDVFAVPGNIYAPQSKGTNLLIQQGAHPLLSGRDLLDNLNLTRVNEQHIIRHAIPSNSTEENVLNILGREPKHVDEIRSQTGLPIESVSAALVMMELKGMVQQVGGMNYIAVREEKSDYLVDNK